jgi:hypothetical protein
MIGYAAHAEIIQIVKQMIKGCMGYSLMVATAIPDMVIQTQKNLKI